MSVSILVVYDEPDVAELFRQCFRLEVRRGTYVMHFAKSGDEALELLSDEIQPKQFVYSNPNSNPELRPTSVHAVLANQLRPNVPGKRPGNRWVEADTGKAERLLYKQPHANACPRPDDREPGPAEADGAGQRWRHGYGHYIDG